MSENTRSNSQKVARVSSAQVIQTKYFLLGLSISVLVIVSFFFGAVADRVFVVKPVDYLVERAETTLLQPTSSASTMVGEGNVDSVADISQVASESVVTVSVKTKQTVLDPFTSGIFGLYLGVPTGEVKEVQQDIGTGFVVSQDGLIVTNKHVVSQTDASYLVVDKNDQEYEVTNIYRDPVNDLAILKVDAGLPALPMGDSDQIRVGESVIAIGTALGEFRHTVTTGVISGLGRGIQASDTLGTYIENIENVIQTDAAINPGNSGGPLLNSKGQVIGVSVAVSSSAENIGFALPINVVKSSIDNFNATGQFERAFFGVRYSMISKDAALMNEVPQGAYVLEVIEDSTAQQAGIETGDIITKFDGTDIKDDVSLAELINQKKIGQKVEIEYYRGKEKKTVEVTLQSQ